MSINIGDLLGKLTGGGDEGNGQDGLSGMLGSLTEQLGIG